MQGAAARAMKMLQTKQIVPCKGNEARAARSPHKCSSNGIHFEKPIENLAARAVWE
jgi:hypothetical protein